jgi:hypothetical protein
MQDLEAGSQAKPWGEARLPYLIMLKKGALILEPWDPMIDQEFEIEENELKGKVLPVAEPFSRLWLDEGVWRPVGH